MSAATSLVAELRGEGLPATLVGGKGCWLDRLVGAGFAVPTCVTLTTECYRAVVADRELAALLTRLGATAVPTAQVAAESQGAIDEAFLAVPLPERVVAAIAEAVAACGGDGATSLAVRSSATAEDLSTMSFAGQYRSFLDQTTTDEVTRAVRLVWASLWHPAPRMYRHYHGVDESDLAMAVVMMPMVPAERAGVAFSVAPGAPESVRVETVHGLGEQLVSGAVTPVVSLVPRRATAGPADEYDQLAARVARLAIEVEGALGAAQDIEWAWDGSVLSLLQARPIASMAAAVDDGYDTPTAPTERWTTAGIAETLPGVLPPLQWETAGLLLEEAFRTLFDELRVLPDGPDATHLIGRFRGRAALNLGMLEELALALPGGSPGEVERQYFGRATGEHPATEGSRRAGRLHTARHDVAVLRVRHRSSREAEIVIAAVRSVVDGEVHDGPSPASLLSSRRRLLDLSARAMAAEVGVAASAVAAYRRLESWLARRFPRRDAESWAQRLTAHHGANRWWEQLTDSVIPFLEGEALANTPGWAEAEERLLATTGGRRVCDQLRVAARRAGSMAVFGGPCWDEDPDLVWDLVRSAAERHSAASMGDTSGEPPLPDHTWADFRTVLDALPPRGGLPMPVVDGRMLAVRRLVDEAVELLDRRERSKAAVLALGGQVRRVQLELGRLMADDGLLDRPEDVELLGERELAAAIAGGCPAPADLGRRRRWLQRCDAEEPLPQRFEGRPSPQRVVRPRGTELRGWAAGPGVYVGRARVLRSPTERMGDGEVLVASSTDASWSPLFLHAGAIAVEHGGPLSHAAIVARELGIPAVLNVPGLVSALDLEPTTVTVDGDRGLIVIADSRGDPNAGGDEESGRPLEEAPAP